MSTTPANDAYLYSQLAQVAAYYQAKGHPVTLVEIWAFVKHSPIATAPITTCSGTTCPRRIQKDGRVCGRALVPGLTVCKIHSPKTNDPTRAVCQRIKPAVKGGGMCGRQVFKTKEGELLDVCQYHRFDPPSPKRKVAT